MIVKIFDGPVPGFLASGFGCLSSNRHLSPLDAAIGAMASIHQKDQVTWNTVTFPSFRDGNVSILLENPAVLKIQLHRAVLSKHSKWFEAMFEEIDEKRLQGPEQQQPQYEFALTRATKESPLSLILVANVGSHSILARSYLMVLI